MTTFNWQQKIARLEKRLSSLNAEKSTSQINYNNYEEYLKMKEHSNANTNTISNNKLQTGHGSSATFVESMNGIKKVTDTRIWSLLNSTPNSMRSVAPSYDVDPKESRSFALRNNGGELVVTKEKYFKTNEDVTSSLVNVVLDAITNKNEPENVIKCTTYSNYSKYNEADKKYNLKQKAYIDEDEASTMTGSTTIGLKQLQDNSMSYNVRNLASKQLDKLHSNRHRCYSDSSNDSVQNNTSELRQCSCKYRNRNDTIEEITRESIQNIKLELKYLEEILSGRECVCN